MTFLANAGVAQAQVGSIRGVVHDRDFEAPLPSVRVTNVDTGQTTTTGDGGNYVLQGVAPGRYTLTFSKEGYLQQVKSDVVVTAGQLTEVNVWLSGSFTDMEEFVVQDVLQLVGGSEAALLQLRFDSPALLDSISSELMSRAGASDAASALRLVAGASVQEGKFAVVRGLPDRYVSSQMNSVRLPTADEDKRAVELDQFPAAVIDSIRVTKTFTPDQQGDASGGAVDVRLRGIPEDQFIFQFKTEYSGNSQVYNRRDFLSYDGGGVNGFGREDDRDPQPLGQNWNGAVGTSEDTAPQDYKFSVDLGGSHEFDEGVRIGAFVNFFYERDSSFYDNGKFDSRWVEFPGAGLTPETNTQAGVDFYTSLFDVTQASQLVQWGGLGTVGIEAAGQALGLTYLYTRTAEDEATLAIDTRGKEYFFPGYDPDNLFDEGNSSFNVTSAPYIRSESLTYTERVTQTVQLNGRHEIPVGGLGGDDFELLDPVFDWTLARSRASQDEPDKRQFVAWWRPRHVQPDGTIADPVWMRLLPGDNVNLGNLQRTFKEIKEDSNQYFLNLKLPFQQWTEDEGYWKAGLFRDKVERVFDQDTFSNFGDLSSSPGDFEDPWSADFPFQNHPITDGPVFSDVDYDGELGVSSWYGMMDLPLVSRLNVIGGARVERTKIEVINHAEPDALWFPPGASSGAFLAATPGAADVDLSERDLLPSIGAVFRPHDLVTLRASYSETVARPTFKELTPIVHREFVGGPIFIGNSELELASVENHDLRAEYSPLPGSLFSVSWFHKDIENPIEYVQRYVGFNFTTARNYPKGELDGWEFEVRQDLGLFYDPLHGLSLGANATLIDAEVWLPQDEIDAFSAPAIQAPMQRRDMLNAPEHIYNFYVTYDFELTGTELAVFYTVQGDTLVAGAGIATNNFVPAIYAKEYDTLNVSVTQRLGDYLKLRLQAKNLTNPRIETVYRSDFTGPDVTRTSFTNGVDYSLGLTAQFRF